MLLAEAQALAKRAHQAGLTVTLTLLPANDPRAVDVGPASVTVSGDAGAVAELAAERGVTPPGITLELK